MFCNAIFYNIFLLTLNKSSIAQFICKSVEKYPRLFHTKSIISYQIVGALANRAVILVRAETVVALHLAIVQRRFARFAIRMMIEIGIIRRWWTMRTTLAGIGRYRVLAGLAHGSLTGRGSVLVADASDAVALLPLLAESPRDTLVNTVLRLLLGFHPGDRI